ncbi:hypothetical protein D3C87_1839360 [compost metagenome]
MQGLHRRQPAALVLDVLAAAEIEIGGGQRDDADAGLADLLDQRLQLPRVKRAQARDMAQRHAPLVAGFDGLLRDI